MEEEQHIDETLFWEIPEIDLNLRHYSGGPSDVIKRIKSDIERYLSNPNLQENRAVVRYKEDGTPYLVTYNLREVYSAVYNALNYYKDISYLPSAEYGTGATFLSNSIRIFNEDYEYLSSKYNSSDPNEPPVIDFSGRIKSPLSLVDKIREKVTEYIEQDRDFGYFNESLRDLIGMRVIVNPPKEIQEQGLQAESDYLYKVFYDLMQRHGITGFADPEVAELGAFFFIPVNSRHDPHKADKLKSRPDVEGFADFIENGEVNVFIPETRPFEIEQPCVDSVVKDYCRFPKYKGYQSLHVCIIPCYSTNVEHLEIPNCIIPPKCKSSAFEYQFRTAKQNDYAEHGRASHNVEYKPNNTYHRLAVPFYITFDSLEDLTENYYTPQEKNKKPIHIKNKLRLRNFGESFKKFYGFTFEEYFGIPFKKFRDSFESNDRDAILAKTKEVKFDETQKIYYTVNSKEAGSKVILALSQEDIEKLKKILSEVTSPDLLKFFETTHLMDGLTQATPTASEAPKVSNFKPFQLYQLESTSDREQTQTNQIETDLPQDENLPEVADSFSLDDDK